MIGRRDSAKESNFAGNGRAEHSSAYSRQPRSGSDVIVVDMGDLPESHVSITELRRTAKVQYRKRQPAQCNFCDILIKCDMFRHVERCHLDLAQLWRCPVSWCTAWKGTPHDLMDHIRNSHNILERVEDIRLETLFPPWTVTHQVYTESLMSRHSRISNDVLLFSDIGLSLVQHYLIYRRAAPCSVSQELHVSTTSSGAPASVVPTEGRSWVQQ